MLVRQNDRKYQQTVILAKAEIHLEPRILIFGWMTASGVIRPFATTSKTWDNTSEGNWLTCLATTPRGHRSLVKTLVPGGLTDRNGDSNSPIGFVGSGPTSLVMCFFRLKIK